MSEQQTITSRAQLGVMTPDQINDARRAGLIDWAALNAEAEQAAPGATFRARVTELIAEGKSATDALVQAHKEDGQESGQ